MVALPVLRHYYDASRLVLIRFVDYLYFSHHLAHISSSFLILPSPPFLHSRLCDHPGVFSQRVPLPLCHFLFLSVPRVKRPGVPSEIVTVFLVF